MKTAVRYGRGYAEIEIAGRNFVCELRASPPLPLRDPGKAVAEALEEPIGASSLAEIASGRKSAVIVVSDITRPAPNELFLTHICAALAKAGIPDSKTTVLIATGAHRPNEGDELDELMGRQFAGRYRVVNHVARDSCSHDYLGEAPGGVPIYVDRSYIAADLRILTGLIEPHYMAGFSGGRKLICPGLAAIETIRQLHSPLLLMHENSDTARLAGNPVHGAALACARAAGVDFTVNAAVDEQRRVTGVWAGELEQAHEAGCEVVLRAAKAYSPEPVDIVITSNAGHPLDASVYQATKGMVCALPIMKAGGTVIIAAACPEGLGSADFASVISAHQSIDEALARLDDPNRFVIDQWGVVMLAKAALRADVLIYSEGLSDDDARSAFLTPIADLQAGLSMALDKHGSDAKVAVIPDGPYVIPALKRL